MNPSPPYSVLKYYESKCTATSLSSSHPLFIFFPHAISSQQTNFAPAVSAPQKKPYFFYFLPHPYAYSSSHNMHVVWVV